MTEARSTDSAPNGAPARRRRWPWIVAALVILGALLVALGPTLVGTGPIKGAVLGMAGSRLGATVTAETLDLSWFGDQRVAALDVSVPPGTAVARVEQASLDQGLWSLLWGPRRLGPVEVSQATLYLGPLAQLEEKVAPPGPPEPAAPEAAPPKPPLLPARVTIKDVRLFAGDAEIYVDSATFEAGDAEDTFDASVTVTHDGRDGTAKAHGTLTGLSRDWRGAGAVGVDANATVTGVPASALGQVLQSLGVQLTVAGTLGGQADIVRERTGTLRLDATWAAPGLTLSGDALEGDTLRLGDQVALTTNLTLEDGVLTARTVDLTTDVATATARGTFALPTGDDDAAPAEGTGHAEFTADLAKLAAMLPKTLSLHEDVTVTRGRLSATVDMTRGPQGAELRAVADVKDLAGTRAGRAVVLQPVHLEATVARQEDQVRIDPLVAEGAFGRLSGQGTLDRFTLTANLDLAKAVDEAEQFVDMQGTNLAGTATVQATTERTDDGRIRFLASTDVTNFVLALDDGRRWEEPTLSASAEGLYADQPTADQPMLDLTQARVSGRAGKVTAKATVRRAEGGTTLDARADGDGRVAALAQQLSGLLGREEVPDAAGTWTMAATAAGTVGGEMTVGLTAGTTNLAYAPPVEAGAKTERRATGDLALEAEATVIQAETGRTLRITKADLTGPGLDAKASGTVALSGERVRADGTATADLAMAPFGPVLKALGAVPAAATLQGNATVKVSAETRGDVLSGSGTATTDALKVDLGKDGLKIDEPDATVPVTFRYDMATREFGVRAIDLKSAVATGNVSANITLGEAQHDVTASADLDLNGEPLRGLLAESLPRELALAGTYHVKADLAGPMPAGDAPWNKKLAGMTGGGTIEVGSFDYRGLRGEGGTIAWTLRDGAIELGGTEEAPSRVPVNDGTLNVGGRIVLTETPATYEVASPLGVVSGVRLTGELAREMLAYVSPLLGENVSPQGRMSMELSRVRVPLDATIRQAGLLRGTMTIDDYTTELKGVFAVLAGWAGVSKNVEKQTLGPQPVHYENGRFHLENQLVRVAPEVQFRMNGTVAADGALEMIVGVPLTETMLSKAGVPVRGRGGLLVDKLVRFPIDGTVSAPRLDEGRIPEVILATVRDLFIGGGQGLGDLIGDIFKRKPEDGEEKAPEGEPEAAPDEQPAPEGEAPPQEGAEKPPEDTPEQTPEQEKKRDPLDDLIDLF